MKVSMLFLSLTTVFIISCKKNIDTGAQEFADHQIKVKVSSPTSISSKSSLPLNNWLIFEKLGDYEKLVDSLNDEEQMKYVESFRLDLNFRSLNSSSIETGATSDPATLLTKEMADSLDNSFFGGVLNPDGIVQVGKYIIKVNCLTGFCYVLNARDMDFVNDLLKENTNNSKIIQYSNEDDVIDILFNKGSSQNLTERNARRKTWNQDYVYKGEKGEERKLECKLVYQDMGIYFDLQGKIKNVFKANIHFWWGPDPTWLNMTFYAKFVRKGWRERIDTGTRRKHTHTLDYRPYSGTRGLERYIYQAEFFRENFGGGPYVTSGWHEIRDGY